MSRLRTRLCALALLAGLGPHAAWGAPPEFVVTATVVPELKAVFGQVESRTVVPARARIGGTVRTVGVSEGSEVAEDQVIARVVDDKLALQLDAANARIQEIKSQLENALTELDRAQQLREQGNAPQSRVDLAQTQFNVITSQIVAAEADKAVIVERASEGDVLAPASGRVLTVPVTPGSVVLAGDEIARVASGQYYLRLSLPERHAADIKEGDSVLIGRRGLSPHEAGGVEAARPGRIAKVYPEISEGRVIADVEVSGIGSYFVNERTLVWLPVGTRTVLAVPPEAVATRHGIDYVRIVADGGPLDVAVVLGETFQDEGTARVEVLTGLRPGDRIILREGDQ